MILQLHKTPGNVMVTGRLMRRMAIAFAGDVNAYLTESPFQFFERVRAIPYRADPEGMEFLQRPAITLAKSGPGGDCDDKSIVLAAYFFSCNIPFHLIAASRKANGPLHHVWVIAYIDGKWHDFDCTYAWNSPGETIGTWPLKKVIG